MASTHKSLRSGTANKRPTTSIADGQIALNTNTTSPGLFFKDSTGATIIKVGPVHVGTTAPNASPAAGGSAGNSVGEIWLDTSLTPVGVKIWNGSAFVNATPIGSTTVQGLLELATNAETQTGTDPDRAVTPAGLQSKVSDSTSTTSSTTIASSTAVKSAYDLANAALPKSGGTVTGNLEIGTTGSLSFEGATADAFETTIAVVDPTADRTITLPDTTGTVITTGDTGTVTSTMIADGTIVNGDINASAAIAHSKLANITAGSVLLGNATNVPTATALSGDVTVNSTGVTAISSGVIVNADVNASAAIAGTKISPDFGSQTITTTGVVSAALGAAATPSITFTGDTNTGIYSPGADQLAISTGGSGRLFVDASGRVGVGGTPNARFEITTGAGTEARITSTVDNNADLTFYTNSVQRGIVEGNSLGMLLGTTGALPTTFITNNTERLRITSAGLVGVGTSSPDASFRATIAGSRSAVSPGIFFSDTDASPNNYALYINGTKNFVLRDQTNTADRLTVTPAGLVGIGTSSPAALVNTSIASAANTTHLLLSETGTTGSSEILIRANNSTQSWNMGAIGFLREGTGDNFALRFFTAPGATNTERMRIDSSGRVGIGTTPSERFHVSGGNSRFEGNYVSFNNNGYIRTDATNELRLQMGSSGTVFANAGNTEIGRWDSSGRFLVGTSSSSAEAKFIVQGGTTGSGGAMNIQRNVTTASTGSTIGFINFTNSSNNVGATVLAEGDGTWSAGTSHPTRLVFSTTADGASTPTERMRITQDGRVGVNATNFTNGRLITESDGSLVNPFVVRDTASGTGSVNSVVFYRGSTSVGTISTTGSATGYNTSSDYRLKENVVAVTNGITRLQQLKPSRFNFITDPGKTVDGFLAHEVQTVVPEAIHGTKDEVDADGKPVYQGIDQSKLVPLLTAALQEAVAKIESLEARLTAAGI